MPQMAMLEDGWVKGFSHAVLSVSPRPSYAQGASTAKQLLGAQGEMWAKLHVQNKISYKEDTLGLVKQFEEELFPSNYQVTLGLC